MVTDEERDYMYRAYADEPAMRINLGIRRRLAPLVGNDRRKMELLNGLLFSLPGTPVLYYGDEIGMGDNVYLGDRNGVRTPMQWSADRNAGLLARATRSGSSCRSSSTPSTTTRRSTSKRSRTTRTRSSGGRSASSRCASGSRRSGAGSIEVLEPGQPARARVRAAARRPRRILVVANLSRFVQYVELDLSKYQGHGAGGALRRRAVPGGQRRARTR